jgi:hypothetical protein
MDRSTAGNTPHNPAVLGLRWIVLVVSSSEVWIGNLLTSGDSIEGILFQTVVALTAQLSVVYTGVEPFEQLCSND